jgi:hypothetical protein
MNAVCNGSPGAGWTSTRWVAAIAIVFALHVVLIFIFGARKPIPPVPVKNAPSLTLVRSSGNSWIALNDATLFALPNPNGFSGPMWTAYPPLPFHKQDWTEDPHWLADTASLPLSELGAAFNGFMQTNYFAGVQFGFFLPPSLAAPVILSQPTLAQNSTLQIRGEIAKRPLLNSFDLPSWPYADVIAPSVVQVLVDAAGNVVSATLLPPNNSLQPSAVRFLPQESLPPAIQYPKADQHAVELARSARFAPLSPYAGSIESNPLTRFSMGELIFNWQTVPVTANGQ